MISEVCKAAFCSVLSTTPVLVRYSIESVRPSLSMSNGEVMLMDVQLLFKLIQHFIISLNITTPFFFAEAMKKGI